MAENFSLFLSSDDADLNEYTTDDFTIKFETPIELNGIWEVGLVQATLWYSFPNIDNIEYNNALFQYNNGLADIQFTIPDGTYSVQQLSDTISTTITSLGDDGTNISIVPNYSTLKITLLVQGGYNVDLSVSNFYQLLGFSDAQTLAPITTNTIGDNLADITNGVDNLYIRTSIATDTYIGSNNLDAIYSFVPNVPPGSVINLTPPAVKYIRVNEDTILDRIRIFVTDQLSRRINFRGETASYFLHLRRLE